MSTHRRILSVLVGAIAVTNLSAQNSDAFYAFNDRKAKTPLEATIARLMPSIVKVHGASGLKTIKAYATGIIVSKTGYILTLDLIMIQEGSTRVALHDGTVLEVEVLPANDKYGVRMLKIPDEDLKKLKKPLIPLVPAKNQKQRNGSFVVSIGNCFRLAEFSEKMSANLGVIVSRMNTGLRYRLREVDYGSELIVTDAPNNPGHYGGGLFTIQGAWIGVNTKIVESTQTNSQVSAAIPTGEIAGYIQRCIEKGAAGAIQPAAEEVVIPVFHGIELFDHGRRVSPPAYVERVKRGSPGRVSGLRPDDLIVQIDGRTVRTCRDFSRYLKKFKPGDIITLTYKRGSKVRQTTLKLEEVK